MITNKHYKIITVSYEDSGYLYIMNVSNKPGKFDFYKYSNPSWTPNVEYSLNGVDWLQYNFTYIPTIIIPPYARLYLRGKNTSGFNRSYYENYRIRFSTPYLVGGNILSLLDYEHMDDSNINLPQRCFEFLFGGDVNLTSIKNMQLGNLTQITGSGDFAFLENTFNGCTSLIDVFDISHITNIGTYVFNNCFRNCTSLTIGLDLRNLTSASRASLESLYVDCRNLATVYAPNVSSWDTSVFSNWMYNAGRDVTGTKTFYAPTGLTIPTDSNSGIPTGWTRVDY